MCQVDSNETSEEGTTISYHSMNKAMQANIFEFLIFKAKSKKEQQTKQKKLDFINSKPNTGNQKTNREKQRKYFWSFCV
jgi:hypothetical protein